MNIKINIKKKTVVESIKESYNRIFGRRIVELETILSQETHKAEAVSARTRN